MIRDRILLFLTFLLSLSVQLASAEVLLVAARSPWTPARSILLQRCPSSDPVELDLTGVDLQSGFYLFAGELSESYSASCRFDLVLLPDNGAQIHFLADLEASAIGAQALSTIKLQEVTDAAFVVTDFAAISESLKRLIPELTTAQNNRLIEMATLRREIDQIREVAEGVGQLREIRALQSERASVSAEKSKLEESILALQQQLRTIKEEKSRTPRTNQESLLTRELANLALAESAARFGKFKPKR
jgi:hypothetical protein